MSQEERIINKQLIKNMILNFIAFTIIFSLFGAFIYANLSISLYRTTDNQLLQIKEQEYVQLNRSIRMNTTNSKTDGQKNPDLRAIDLRPEDAEEIKVGEFNDEGRKFNLTPRMIQIVRDENKNIINHDEAGGFYSEYINKIGYVDSDQVYTYSLDGKYLYRGISFQIVTEEGEIQYLQILANVDTEKEVLDSFLNIIVIGIIFSVALSIVASYILSKRTLEPIKKAWKKQTEFVQNASHELRTPLTIIQAKQELLLKAPDAKIIDKSEDIAITLEETKRLSKLIHDLLMLAKADSNQKINKEKCNLDEIIKTAIEPYMDLVNVKNEKIRIDLDFNEAITIDRNEIHQLMIILLDNAMKYTDKDEKINIKTYKKDGKCCIEVADEGIGISREDMPHIFERFYREDKARNREKGGSGLGLSIALWIVNAHKGTIKVTSNTPKGTVFTVKLPI